MWDIRSKGSNVLSEIPMKGESLDNRRDFRALFQTLVIILYYVLATPTLIFVLSPNATSDGHKVQVTLKFFSKFLWLWKRQDLVLRGGICPSWDGNPSCKVDRFGGESLIEGRHWESGMNWVGLLTDICRSPPAAVL